MPPPHQIWIGWFHASFPDLPHRKHRRLDASPQRGVKETSQTRLRYENWKSRVPSMGLRMCQLVATPCVASSLALGSSDLSGGFCIRTLSIGRPTVIVLPILDMVSVSLDEEGMICEEWGSVKAYNALHRVLQGPGASPPQLLIPWGLDDTRMYLHTPTSSHTSTIIFPLQSFTITLITAEG
jgi:hypothetical protein